MPNTDSNSQDVADRGSGREAAAILSREVRAQLQAGQQLGARLQAELEHVKAEATSMTHVITELQHDRGQKKEAQPEDAVRIRPQVAELALKACSHVESRTKSALCARAWYEKVAVHIKQQLFTASCCCC